MGIFPDARENSFGSVINDLFGSIRALETGEPFAGSHDPNGNRFDGKTIPEMFSTIGHFSLNDLQIINQRLDDFYSISSDQPKPEDLPPQYTEAKGELQKLIQEASIRLTVVDTHS